MIIGAAVLIMKTSFFRSSSLYWILSDHLVTPLLRKLSPEIAHDLTIKALEKGFSPVNSLPVDPVLQTKVWGVKFDNPLGLAAGFDKQALVMEGLSKIGFGFIEVGGVTPLPQEGNPKPRVFRLKEDRALVNRMGLNNDGHEAVAKRLASYRAQSKPGIIGINIAKSTSSDDMIGDYKKGIRNLGKFADFIVLNVSCPNVSWTKNLSKNEDGLKNLVFAIKEERARLVSHSKNLPLLLKLAPNMSFDSKKYMAQLALDSGIDGLVVSNTTPDRDKNLLSSSQKEKGGLSGAPLKALALQTLKDMYALTQGAIPIIGVGGIENAQDAYERIRSGASLVQIYTAMIYQGPGIVPRIKKELAELLKKDHFKSVADAVGVDA